MVKSLISGNMEENKILGEHSDLFQIIKDTMELKDIDIINYSPLTLAYIGDGIYEIVIRTIIVDQANRQVNKIHKAASNLVKAHTQAEMIFAIMDKLTEQELAIYKRGRNALAFQLAQQAVDLLARSIFLHRDNHGSFPLFLYGFRRNAALILQCFFLR